nr:hypothetical protein [Tanacetum cinerariifolium]
MHQFWNTIKKIGRSDAYDFKLDKKKCRVNTEVFHEILQFCPRIPNQDFVELPLEEYLLTLIKEFGYSGRCISGKSTGLDRLRESRAQILWAMYNQMNVDYVALLWEDFMYQADNREISSARKGHMPYPRFTKVIIDHFISKDNTISMKNMINLHSSHDDTLLGTLKFVSKTEDYHIYGAVIPNGMINDDIKISKAYKNYLNYAIGKVPPKKARKFKKPASPKLKTVLASPKEPTQKDTSNKFVSKKKAQTKTGRRKGIEQLSDAALLEEAQMKKALKKRKTKDTSEGTGVKQGVLDVSKDNSSEINNDSWGDSEDESDDDHDEDDNYDEDDNDDDDANDVDDGNDDDCDNDDGHNDAQDSEQTDSNDEENPSFTLKDYEEEEQDEEDTDLTKARQDINSLMNASTIPPPSFPVNLSSHPTTIPQQQTPDSTTTTTYPTTNLLEILNFLASKLKEEVNVAVRSQSNKLKEEAEAENQEFINQVDSTIKQIIKEQVKAQVSKIMPRIKKYVIKSLGSEVLVRHQKNLYNALIEAYNSDNDIFTSYGDVVILKRGRDDQDKDEDPFVGSNRGTKGRKSSKDAKPSKGSKSKESKSSNIEMHHDQGNESGHIDYQPDNEAAPQHDWFQKPDKPPTPDRVWNKSKSVDFRPPQKWIGTIAKECYKERKHPCTFDELMSTPINFSAYDCLKIDNLTQEILVGPAFNLLKGRCKSFAKLEFHFEECYKAINDWHNSEGREYPFDLSKPLSLIEDQGRQVVSADYFINNDLEYLKGGSSSSKYSTSTTRTKAPKYNNIEGIEDMVLRLWSPVKVAYNKHAVWGTYYRGLKRQRFYAYACHWKSPHDVYSKRRIIVITSVKVMRWYDCGYLEEIVVRIDDNVLYKFKEGDFLRLNLSDIEDMLLLLVQKKLSNFDVDYRYDLGVALRIFTRRNVILHRIKDLQLGVESYQKKLNITRPDKYKRNRLMRSDELYKFCDRTLSFVRRVLHDIPSNLDMDYLPKRHWSNLEMKRSCIMVKAIDKLLFERRLMRNLEKFVGGRDYGNDLRLLDWTI